MLDELLAALGYVGETLDKPGAAVRGVLSGRPEQLLNLIPFSDTLGITDPTQRVGGRQLLEEYGMLGENTPGLDWGDVGGFLAEEALDPVNLIPGGFFAKRGVGMLSQLDEGGSLLSKLARGTASPSAPLLRWSDDVEGRLPGLMDQEVAEIDMDWLFEKNRLDSVLPQYQTGPRDTVLPPDEVGDLLERHRALQLERRYGAQGTPVEPAELELLYRKLHGRRLDRYRNWLGQHAELGPDGQPLKLYHGTGGVFDEFSAKKFGEGAGGNYRGTGVYLTDNPNVASSYANQASPHSLDDLFTDRPLDDINPINVRFHHVLGPVADETTYGGLESILRTASDALPEMKNPWEPDAEAWRRSGLMDDYAHEAQMLRLEASAREGDALKAIHATPRTVDSMGWRSGPPPELLAQLEAEERAFDVANAAKYAADNAWRVSPPQSDHVIGMIEDTLLDRMGKPSNVDPNLGDALPGFTGIRHQGGMIFGGPRHKAYAMFSPESVLPVNPSMPMLQMLAERFKDPQTGALPFSLLAALGAGGAAAYGGQQSVY